MHRALAILVCLSAVAAAEDKKCVVEKLPAATPAKIKAAPCHRPPKKIETAVADAIKKKFQPEQGGKPEVKFDCDGLGATIYEIVVETGSGHGGTLGLWRAKRRPDGKYDVRGIVYRGNSMTHAAAAIPHVQADGVVALELDTVRAGATAKIREVVPPPKPGEGLGRSSSFSSRDFHFVLRMVDADGRVLEKRYTGYASSSAQADYLGLEVAQHALAPLTSVAETKNAADADDKRFFAASFDAALPHFDDQYFWWVMERYVDLARFLGGPSTIPGLLTRLAPQPKDRSKIDARNDAVDAIARITGWDPRKDGKSVEDTAKLYVTECK